MSRKPESTDGGVRRPRPISLTDGEWAWVFRKAKKAGVSAAEWVRRLILRGYSG